jgi:uncharacterized glyoxalase superfamily protein PhnB
MKSDWKPEGYSAVSVYLVVDGAQRVIDFLKKTFDATALRRFDTPDGKIIHAEVRIGDTVVMIADAGGSYLSGLASRLSTERGLHLQNRPRGRRRPGTGIGPQRR